MADRPKLLRLLSMLIAWVPVLVAIAGLLLFWLAKNPKLEKIGGWLFWIGTFFTVWGLVGESVRLIGHR